MIYQFALLKFQLQLFMFIVDGKDLATLAPKYVNQDVSVGGVAAIVIVLLIVGVALVAVPFLVITRKKKDLHDFNRSQLTMSDLAE